MAKIRISAAGFKAGPIKTFGDFADHCTQLVDQARSDTPDFLVFPELFTTELMTFFEESDLLAKFAKLATYTDDYRSLFKELAKKNGFHIIAGSHLKEVDGKNFIRAISLPQMEKFGSSASAICFLWRRPGPLPVTS